jgi:small subunit ribosomal protein S17
MKEQSKRKILEGVVVRAKADKTVLVNVERKVQHPIFGKVVSRRSKYMVHDEHKKCAEGARVKIIETRPLSKMKRWRVLEILEESNSKK